MVKRAALDSWASLDYIVHKAVMYSCIMEDDMLNLFSGFEWNITLQIALLICGCATFFGVVLYSRCPNCSWLEWIGDKRGGEDEE